MRFIGLPCFHAKFWVKIYLRLDHVSMRYGRKDTTCPPAKGYTVTLKKCCFTVKFQMIFIKFFKIQFLLEYSSCTVLCFCSTAKWIGCMCSHNPSFWISFSLRSQGFFYKKTFFWSSVFVTADDIALLVLCKGSGLFSPYLLYIYALWFGQLYAELNCVLPSLSAQAEVELFLAARYCMFRLLISWHLEFWTSEFLCSPN